MIKGNPQTELALQEIQEGMKLGEAARRSGASERQLHRRLSAADSEATGIRYTFERDAVARTLRGEHITIPDQVQSNLAAIDGMTIAGLKPDAIRTRAILMCDEHTQPKLGTREPVVRRP